MFDISLKSISTTRFKVRRNVYCNDHDVFTAISTLVSDTINESVSLEHSHNVSEDFALHLGRHFTRFAKRALVSHLLHGMVAWTVVEDEGENVPVVVDLSSSSAQLFLDQSNELVPSSRLKAKYIPMGSMEGRDLHLDYFDSYPSVDGTIVTAIDSILPLMTHLESVIRSHIIASNRNAAPRLFLQKNPTSETDEANDILLEQISNEDTLQSMEFRAQEEFADRELQSLNERVGSFSMLFDKNDTSIEMPKTTFVRLPKNYSVANLASKSSQQRDAIDFLKHKNHVIKRLFGLPTDEVRRVKAQEIELDREYQAKIRSLSESVRAFLAKVYSFIYKENATFASSMRVSYNVTFEEIVNLRQLEYLSPEGFKVLLSEKAKIDPDYLDTYATNTLRSSFPESSKKDKKPKKKDDDDEDFSRQQ